MKLNWIFLTVCTLNILMGDICVAIAMDESVIIDKIKGGLGRPDG
jgi:hypothetical protein